MKAKIDAKNILIFNPSFIGDAILTTPLIKVVKYLFPHAKITLCVRPESAPLFINTPPIDDVLIFDKHKTAKGVNGLLSFTKTVRNKNFDLVITPHKSLRSLFALFFANIPVRVGFKQSAFSSMLNCKVSRYMSLHEVERNLMLLEPIVNGFTLEKAKEIAGKPITYLDKSYQTDIGVYLRTAAKGEKIVGINAGSTWNTKRWPVEYFAELAKKLNNAGVAVVIIGGPADITVNDKLTSLLDFEYFNFVNKVDFSKIPALISRLDLLVTNDSAPLHIAVSQNIPAVAIFGPTVKELGFFPYDDVSVVCEVKRLYCRPCGLHGGKKCPEKHFRCMNEITPTDVYNAVIKLLRSK